MFDDLRKEEAEEAGQKKRTGEKERTITSKLTAKAVELKQITDNAKFDQACTNWLLLDKECKTRGRDEALADKDEYIEQLKAELSRQDIDHSFIWPAVFIEQKRPNVPKGAKEALEA